MTLFSLLGFQRIEKQLNTAFNFLRDPEPYKELQKMWDMNNKRDEIIERKMPQMSNKPMESEFKVDEEGKLQDNHG